MVVRADASDALLMARHRAGDPAAFGVLHERHRASLTRLAVRLVGHGRADDMVQEAFERAHRVIVTGSTELRLGPWLHTVVRNRCLDELRRGVPAATALGDIAATGLGPHDRAELAERLQAVSAAVKALPVRQRQALVWQVVDGAPHDLIARRLEVSVAATKGLVNRARREVRHSDAA